MPKGKDRPQATCHPDRLHRARGLCDLCYSRAAFKWRDPKKRSASQRRAYMKAVYKLSEEQYSILADAQGYRCAICKKEKKLFIDHCHNTGCVRGLLCSKCNSALGFFDDSLPTVIGAVDYLQKSV